MKLILYTIILVSLFFTSNLSAQERNCATVDILDRQIQNNPSIIRNMEEIERQTQEFLRKNPKGLSQRNIITIPVVFHVVSDIAVPVQNISDAQIQSQIDVLNQDYRASNSDFSNTPAIFSGVAADVEIEFCLAKRDPNGNATTGINRKTSSKTYWGTDDSVKKSSLGGIDPWNASSYLNIWICRISQSNTNVTLGYAQFPGGSSATDGVVLDYRFTGTIGTAVSPFNKGRTATHEIGHWLNLKHIWGDASCGNDLVSDTPVHNAANSGCPAYPHLSTCSGTPVEMTMNYLDYTDDACMYMFTVGQKARMQAVLASGGARSGLSCSSACLAPGQSAACDAPTGLSFTSITSASATANWNAPPNAINYTLEYKPDFASTWTVITPVAGTSYNMTGLSAGQFYNFRVKTNCNGSSSCGYNLGAFATSTPPAPCPDNYESNNTSKAAKSLTVGTTLKAKILTATDVDWFKFANTKTNKNIKVSLTNLPANYDVKLYRGTTTQVGVSQNLGTTDEQIVYNNILSNTTYYVQVYGVGGAFNDFSCYDLLIQISGSNYRLSNNTDEDEQIEIVANEFLVFPSPATDEITVVMPFGHQKTGILSVFDVAGKLMSSGKVTGDIGLNTVTMDVSQYRAGLYLINFTTDEDTFSQKIIIAERR
ncbi:MAG: M43 family zinc metalloprotease [Saprospiraceae bacterium]|nr:fibronectin type III domain-containing protein [Saprospiraceae bacterium]